MSSTIAVINGPNLNLLGRRSPEIYGTDSLENIVQNVQAYAREAKFDLLHVQSNLEGELVEAVQRASLECAGIIINAAGYSHTSVALRDAVEAAEVPVIEVHLSNIFAREHFRRHSYISEVADGVICGLGAQGYVLAFGALLQLVKRNS